MPRSIRIEYPAQFKKKLAPPHEFSEAAFRKIDHEIWDLRVAVLGKDRPN